MQLDDEQKENAIFALLTATRFARDYFGAQAEAARWNDEHSFWHIMRDYAKRMQDAIDIATPKKTT